MQSLVCSGLVGISIPLKSNGRRSSSNVSRKTALQSPVISLLICSSSTSNSTVTESESTNKFNYSRATPSVRWPHLKLNDNQTHSHISPNFNHVDSTPLNKRDEKEKEEIEIEIEIEDEDTTDSLEVNDENLERLGRPSRTRAKKLTKLALKRAKDWRQRVSLLTHKILQLKPGQFVADVLDEKIVQMTPTDYCFVVKSVGQSSWTRSLEVYEWLNLRQWYSPNARMLATILSVLGKANQEALAVELFTRAESTVGNTVQVYNAMMGVYARNGKFSKVKELLDVMKERGSEPDLVSMNTLINARLKSSPITENLGVELLDEVRKSGLKPDTISYNTLISACSRESNLQEAIKVYADMEACKCQPDLWTYNAMISVFGRCRLPRKAEHLFNELKSKGFIPDAVTYNSLLFAFAREGDVKKVGEICEKMVENGFGKDEMTYNTIIHMHGRNGDHDLGLEIYEEMKSSGRNPDVVTYTVLIDSLGKADKMREATKVFEEMIDIGLQPTLKTYSALICGYAKSGMRLEAEETFHCMVRSGIRPDHIAYSIMLDIHLRSDDAKKAISLYREMVINGFAPDESLYGALFRVLKKNNREEDVERVVNDLEELNLNPQIISCILVKGECYDHAGKMLRKAVGLGYEMDRENLLSILSSYSTPERYSEALDLLNFLKERESTSRQLIIEATIVIHCKARQINAALDEYFSTNNPILFRSSSSMYEFLIKCCRENKLLPEASQLFSDMRFNGIEPSKDLYECMVLVYCGMGLPETAHHLVDEAENIGNVSIYVGLIEAYGKLKLLEKAENLVSVLRRRLGLVDRKAWNALINAYAESGLYERARAAFNTMMKDGPAPTNDTINGLIQSLIIDKRLNEIYVLIEELQDMGFKISKSSILLMLDAFAREGNIFEVKKVYEGMKASGYFPSMHLYRVVIELFCRGKRVKDVEAMVVELLELGFKPDLSIWNSMLKLYTEIEDFKTTICVYQKILEDGHKPDEETYNTLILMYCRDCRPAEGLALVYEMKKQGLEPKLDTYKSLLAAFDKQKDVEQVEELFERLRSEGYKLDRSFYHIMMKTYRSTGNYSKAEKMLISMKEEGVEPTLATMHLLMVSYGSSGKPAEAEKVLNNLKLTDADIMLPYTSVIDAYLKNGDYQIGIQKLQEMRADGSLEPDHRIWTCFIRAASLVEKTSEALVLLNAIADAGFDLPLRLLTEKPDLLVQEVDCYMEKLGPLVDNAAFNFVNALEDLLWAFELRAAASWVLQLAIRRGIYRHDTFRVAEKDWGADFRKFSAGAALVGLTLWLDHMQDASLRGIPQSPKSVVLITGNSEYNGVSLNSTLKAYLWEMGSPFLPCKTRTGLLIAKAHSLRMWLKDSPYCLDLELKNNPSLPKLNSMRLLEGCFIRRGFIHAFNDISEKLGQIRPKKFARLALMTDEERDRVIQAELTGRQEKLLKLEKSTLIEKKRRVGKRKFVRRLTAQKT
ncbi:pentatricopeptide repeat-containing protein At3g18110, chloroplastic [Impatiens glandulifera]|uniref:pentatricopeptide repeat-containing protein At3g18110, chloroplastic n=1 Tax=Impatiens glandulifera TaxID=253017 RepID=UPI001FB0D322|nr:pentatricopeptide repeat-containing protein At3g18110, chloroplastic [Impatiens glandulifera]